MEELLEAVYISLPACAKNLLKVLWTGPSLEASWPLSRHFKSNAQLPQCKKVLGLFSLCLGFSSGFPPSLTVARRPLYFSQIPPNQSQMSEPSVEFWERLSGPE